MNIFSLFTFIIPVVLFFIGAINIILKVLWWVQLWQEKEYRNDRMHDYFTTASGKEETTNKWNIASAIIILILLLFSSMEYSLWIARAVTITNIVAVVLFMRETIICVLRRVQPIWTAKAAVLAGGSIVMTVLLGIGATVATSAITGVLLASFVAPFLVSVLVIMMRPVSQWYYENTIQKAKAKMKTLHPLVIGICGSYGKTSTKEFLTAFLKKKYNVLATPANVNADIGIAKIILERLQPKHDVFIVEMGAYRQGEIRKSCAMVRPTIGILTGINHQHLSLFGSFEQLQFAKTELFESLPRAGFAVFNADNAWCKKAVKKTRAQTIRSYAVQNDDADIMAQRIDVASDHVSWDLQIKGKAMRVRAPLAGAQHIPSILAAASVADYCGVTLADIRSVIARLTPPAGTMQLRQGFNGAIIVDDHYNTNPDGFIAALEYLRLFQQKRKIVVTRGMYELGSESEREHRRIGNIMGSIADIVIIAKNDFAKPLSDSLKQAGMQEQHIIVEANPRRLQRIIVEMITPDDVVLVEGRLQPIAFRLLCP